MKFALFICTALLITLTTKAETRKIEHRTLKVEGANDEWSPTNLKFQAGDFLIIKAAGKVTVGSFLGEVGPDGNPSGKQEGRLQLKIGTATTLGVGSSATVNVDQSGPVKVRVNDTKYTDNKGSFNVDIVLIPAELVPQPTEVKIE
jgi:hypothetical protein